jgi:ketosteroid isomerase-like protein
VADSNIEVVRRGLDAYRLGDVEAVLELLDPDIRWDRIGAREPSVGREQAADAMRAARERTGDLELADAVPFGMTKVMVCLVRTAGEGSESTEGPDRIYNVVTFEEQRIVRLQGFLGRKEAVQAARGTTAASETAPKSKAKGKSKRSPWRRARRAAGRLAQRIGLRR